MTQLAPPEVRRRSGLPRRTEGMTPQRRFLTSHLTWVHLGLIAVSLVGFGLLVQEVVPDRPVPGGTRIGIGTEAWRIAAWYALPTALVLILLFVAAGRWRPRPLAGLVALLWGGGVATFASLKINTRAASQLSIIGDGDPQTAIRAAVFVAPFVEESTKGSVLFILAIVARYLWVNRLNGLVLGALAGVGFAFTENLLYYGRIYRAAAQTYGAVTPDEAVQQLAFLRGVALAFGHPLFTMMIGIGLAIGLAARSRLVRILAPLTGFVVAALLHMIFNSVASQQQAEGLPQMLIYIFGYWGLVITMLIFAIRQILRESRLIRARLTDYARTGQLQPGDPEVMSRLLRRGKALWHGLLAGRPIATWRMQRAMTELAYLRDAMTRGLIDEVGRERERELLTTIAALRPVAVVEPYTRTPRPALPWRRHRPGVPPLGSPGTHGQYAASDPRWGPPR